MACSDTRVEQQIQSGIDRLLFVAGGHIAQVALALLVFPGQFGHRLVGAAVSFLQEGSAQISAPGLETRLGLARCGQGFIKNALPFGARGVNDALGVGFGFQKPLERIFHVLSFSTRQWAPSGSG